MRRKNSEITHTTVEMIVKGVSVLERAAREHFLSTGRNNDAEEWHKIRGAKAEIEVWFARYS